MPDGTRHLRQAAAVLSFLDEDLPSRDVLAKAFREVWLASTEWERWSPDARQLAERLIRLCFRDGAIRDTAHRLTESEARDSVNMIRLLAREADRLHPAKPPDPAT